VTEPQYPSTGGPDQVPPPAPQSGWVQPQPAQTGWVMPAAVAQGPGKVSGLVIIAALFLLLVGVLTALGGAILMLGGTVLGQLGTTDTGTGVFGALGGFIAGVAVVVIVWALLEIFGAFGMLFRRGWGRALGFIVGIIGAIFTGLALLASLGSLGSTDGSSAGTGVLVVLVVFLGYAVTVFALVRGGGHFRRG
jgi:membrane protease YdiL (CAAX protease family)